MSHGLLRWSLERVTWLDSSSHNEWTRLKSLDPEDDMTHDSVGWVVQETEDRVTLAAHVQTGETDNPALAGQITIPKCAIVGRWTLVEGEP